MTTDVPFSWNMPLFRTYARNLCRRSRKSTNKKIRHSVCKSTDETELRVVWVLCAMLYVTACPRIFRSYSDRRCVLKSTKYPNGHCSEFINNSIWNFAPFQTYAYIQCYQIVWIFLKHIFFTILEFN